MEQAKKPLAVAELTEIAAAMRAAGIAEYTTPDGAVIKLGPAPAAARQKPVAELETRVEVANRQRSVEEILYAAGTGKKIRKLSDDAQ